MAPSQNFVFNSVPLEPVSRTYQYRKVMKPMLERKRRARINRCLDELKELMAVALQSEGENVAKLEKADILELTVRHLQGLKEKNSLYVKPIPSTERVNEDSYWQGFRHCANEVSQFLLRFDQKAGIDFLRHIRDYMPVQNLDTNSSTTSNNVFQSSKQYLSPVSSMFFNSSYHRYHQEALMYNNNNNNNISKTFASNFTTINNNIENSCSIDKHSTSDTPFDDDTTVWRPW